MSNEHYYPRAENYQTQGFAGGQTPAGSYSAQHFSGGMAKQSGGGMPMQNSGYAGMPSVSQYAQSYDPYASQQSSSLMGFTNDRFLKGLLIGAAATYLITNESVQKTAIKSMVKVWSMVQGGVEEMKERFQDAEAEIQAAASTKE